MRFQYYLKAGLGAAALAAAACSGAATAQEQAPVFVDQGKDWKDPALRQAFYVQDQGSRIMPLAWMKALKRPDGQPFLQDSFARYGYLANPESADGLPVGFNVAALDGEPTIGMTCAACHTRQIAVDGKAYRIDGGPAIADFQGFLADLDAATGRALDDDAAFDAFADAVLGPAAATPAARSDLRVKLRSWRLRYDALIANALPDPPWGYGRLDAVSMIFNRLTGLDLGKPADSHIIVENIHRADAPVRYPFLWNASRQSNTQWPGFAPNGSDQLALSRNLGEVLGVFGIFEPEPWPFNLINYSAANTANFDGLAKLEGSIKLIGAPAWPWKDGPHAIDQALADKGEAVFNRPPEQGGCAACHGVNEITFPQAGTWDTPVKPVGTDAKEYAVLTRTAHPGVLKGVKIPGLQDQPLADPAFAADILKVAAIGAIGQHTIEAMAHSPQELFADLADFPLATNVADLQRAFLTLDEIRHLSERLAASEPAYEARVLNGVWAAAPYLHNGAVPTLTELLKPPAERVASFKVGPAYDPIAVGLAVEQPAQSSTLTTTLDCDRPLSGNSRCGHDYGTKLSADDKKALLEYLKRL